VLIALLFRFQYLEEHIGETYLDVKQMTRELMQKYPEYSRRKFGPFRQLVHQGKQWANWD